MPPPWARSRWAARAGTAPPATPTATAPRLHPVLERLQPRHRLHAGQAHPGHRPLEGARAGLPADRGQHLQGRSRGHGALAMKNARGFSLVELMVAAIIVSGVISLVFATFLSQQRS